MLLPEILLLMAAVVVFAYVVKGVAGFAEGMTSMSLMLLFIDFKFALIVVFVIMIIADIYLAARFRKDIKWKAIRPMVVPSIFGVVLGAYFLSILAGSFLKSIFGMFVILFSLKILLENHRAMERKVKRGWNVLVGFLGGFLDTVFNSGGPPVVIYFQRLGFKKGAFRASCIMAFLVFDFSRLFAYASSGLLLPESLFSGLVLLPAMVFGSALGIKLHEKMDERAFRKTVAVLLLILGIRLLF